MKNLREAWKQPNVCNKHNGLNPSDKANPDRS